MTKRELKFFEIAKAISRTSEYPKIKIGCCIVKKNKILAVGVNSSKSHPTQKKYNKYRGLLPNYIHNNTHAELDAILKVANKECLKGASIYIYREGGMGHLRMCKPCAACTHILDDYGIKLIYYTDVDGFYRRDKNERI